MTMDFGLHSGLTTPNPRNDLTITTDHDQWSTLIPDTKVMGSSNPIHLAAFLDPTVLATSRALLREFQPLVPSLTASVK
jgi:hypothetical protein